MLHELRQSSPLISPIVCLDFPVDLVRFGVRSRAIYEDLCSFEVLAGHSGFRGRDELRNEFRGRIVGKGYRRSGSLLVTEWLLGDASQ